MSELQQSISSGVPSYQYALEMDEVSKRFENLVAISQVSFKLRKASVHALLGENGAGKTTLMRIAFGMISPDAGDIRIEGVKKSIRSPADAIAAGVGMVHQHFMLASAMTVAENVELGGRGRYRVRESADKVRVLAEQTGLLIDPLATVSTLGIAAQQRLETGANALQRDADIPATLVSMVEAFVILVVSALRSEHFRKIIRHSIPVRTPAPDLT